MQHYIVCHQSISVFVDFCRNADMTIPVIEIGGKHTHQHAAHWVRAHVPPPPLKRNLKQHLYQKDDNSG